jgi:hypothetical protein
MDVKSYTPYIFRNLISYCQSVFFKYINKKYVLPLYEKSDSMYKENSFLEHSWIPIYKNLEISLQMSTRFCDKPSRIAIRNSKDDSISEVILLIEAERCFDESFGDENYRVQKRLRFEKVSSNSRIIQNLDIPPLDFWWMGDNKFIFSYQDLSITVISVIEKDICQKIDKKIKNFSFAQHKFFDDVVEGNWKNISGRYYNIGYINHAKRALEERIIHDLKPSRDYIISTEYRK